MMSCARTHTDTHWETQKHALISSLMFPLLSRHRNLIGVYERRECERKRERGIVVVRPYKAALLFRGHGTECPRPPVWKLYTSPPPPPLIPLSAQGEYPVSHPSITAEPLKPHSSTLISTCLSYKLCLIQFCPSLIFFCILQARLHELLQNIADCFFLLYLAISPLLNMIKMMSEIEEGFWYNDVSTPGLKQAF